MQKYIGLPTLWLDKDNILASRSTRSLVIATQWVSWDTTLKLSLTKPRRSASVASSPFLLSWSAWWQDKCVDCASGWFESTSVAHGSNFLTFQAQCLATLHQDVCNGDCKLATWKINHQTAPRWAPSRFFWLEFWCNPYQWPNMLLLPL